MAVKRIAHKVEYHIEQILTPDAYTQIANVKAINDHELTRDEVDVTSLADDVEAVLPGPILNLGELKLTLFWDEANTDTQGLIEDSIETANPTTTDFAKHKLVFPFADGTVTKIYEGWVKSMGEVTHEVGGEVTREIVIQVTTIPVTS